MLIQPPPTAVKIDGAVRLFCLGRLTVVVPESDTGFVETGRFAAARAEALESPIGLLALVRPGVRGDPLRVRKETQRLLTQGKGSLAAVAFAIDGRGFFASAFMSMASGVFLHVRHAPVPMQAFSRHEDAAVWLAPRIDVPAAKIHGFVATVRAQLEEA